MLRMLARKYRVTLLGWIDVDDLRSLRYVQAVVDAGVTVHVVPREEVVTGLDELLDRSMLDVELYVGISGGAFVSSLLAAGISPREMYDEVTSRTQSPFGVPATPIYRLGALEFLKRSLRTPRVLAEAVVRTLTGEGRNWSDLAWSLFEILPPGLMETSGIQEYLRDLFLSRNRSERFQDLPRELFIVAVDLDSGQSVAFGAEGHRDVPVSRAVQASTALPGLYRPVRINGRDYVDGGVKKTAHINLAIQNGADLVICINPIVSSSFSSVVSAVDTTDTPTTATVGQEASSFSSL
jgi:predicted acylesterase/phospholipase RssA